MPPAFGSASIRARGRDVVITLNMSMSGIDTMLQASGNGTAAPIFGDFLPDM